MNDSSPFLTIWTSPRQTIRQIVATNPTQHVWTLVLLVGALQGLGTGINSPELAAQFGLHLGVFVAAAAAASALVTVIFFVLGGLMVRWTGRWIGGVADVAAVRAALAWGYVPNLAAATLSLVGVLAYGPQMGAAPGLDLTVPQAMTAVLLGFLGVVAMVWTLVIICNTVAEVQGFKSAWKGFLNLILGWFILFVPIMLILASVVFVSLSGAREKANQARERAEEAQRAVEVLQAEINLEGVGVN